MRSSHKVIAGAGETVRGWQPDELGAAVESPRQKDVRALIDVFRPDQPSAESRCSAPRPWEPPDLGQTSQFAGGGQKTIVYFPVAASRRDSAGSLGHADAARREAEALIAEARQQAEEITAAASQAAADAFARAQEEGFAAGRAEVELQLSAVRQVFEQTNAWREEMLAASESILLRLVREIAVALFGQGVELSDSALQQNLNRIVEQAKSLGDLKIYLNPADAAILNPDWREFQATITGNRVQIISSDSITRGGAFVQGQMGTVDGRVETQLRAVLDALAGPSEAEGGLD